MRPSMRVRPDARPEAPSHLRRPARQRIRPALHPSAGPLASSELLHERFPCFLICRPGLTWAYASMTCAGARVTPDPPPPLSPDRRSRLAGKTERTVAIGAASPD